METNDTWSFEEKSLYYARIGLGKDVKAQIRILAEATKELVVAQANLSDRVVISHERIVDGLDYLSSGPDDVREGISGLKAAFEFSLSEATWQIERNRRQLQDILKTLTAHLDTKTKEKRKRADAYYDNDQIDEAEEEYLTLLESNEQDFTLHISLGMIQMFRRGDLEEAVYYFDNAIQYARPKSKYYTSFALLYKAIALREDGLFSEAKACLEEAIIQSPDFCEPLFQICVAEVRSNKQRAISLLTALVDTDIRYSLKIENEPALIPIKKDLHAIYTNRINEQSNEIKGRHDVVAADVQKILERIGTYKAIIGSGQHRLDSELEDAETRVRAALQRAIELVNRKTLLDSYTAARVMASEVPRSVRELREAIYRHFSDGIEELYNEKAEIASAAHSRRDERLLNDLTAGKTGILTYSAIYVFTFIMFRDLITSITLSSIPFTISWVSQYRYHVKRRTLLKRIDSKIEQLVAARDGV